MSFHWKQTVVDSNNQQITINLDEQWPLFFFWLCFFPPLFGCVSIRARPLWRDGGCNRNLSENLVMPKIQHGKFEKASESHSKWIIHLITRRLTVSMASIKSEWLSVSREREIEKCLNVINWSTPDLPNISNIRCKNSLNNSAKWINTTVGNLANFKWIPQMVCFFSPHKCWHCLNRSFFFFFAFLNQPNLCSNALTSSFCASTSTIFVGALQCAILEKEKVSLNKLKSWPE